MSSRALRRLQGNSNFDVLNSDVKTEKNEESIQSEEEAETFPSVPSKKKNKKKKKENKGNLFDVFTENVVDEDEDAVKSDDEDDVDIPLSYNKKQPIAKTKPKKKKKKKAKNADNSCEPDSSVTAPQDEIEASLMEVNRLLGDPDSIAVVGDGKLSHNTSPLLTVDYRNLNPENELKRIFGAEVVRGERQSNQRRRNKPSSSRRGYKLVQPKEGWHSTSGLGLSMVSLPGGQGFAYVHSSVYQDVQYVYYQAVQSGNPENIFTILRNHPYHIDTLIQMADFYRMNEDTQTAAECIEKALFGLENSFHIMFNMAAGNCYLDYRRQENRALHICLFKHILNIGQRGCYRTAFEFCKLLISLDRKVDPLNTMYLIDFYAIRSQQYDFLIRLWHETRDSSSSVIEKVNFALSVPLALYHKGDIKQADQLLQDRLLMYPVILKPLLDKCSVQPDKKVDKHPFFNSNELHDERGELGRIVKMVIERCYPCWKEVEVMSWLEKNVQEVMNIVDEGQDERIKEYATRREARFKGASPCLLRHYLLCEVPNLGLPRSARNLNPSNLMVTDPFPPPDTITVYTPDRVRPGGSSRHNNNQAIEPRDRNMLGLLLQSLLPTYDQNAPPVPEEREAAYDQVEGARGIPAPIHNSVNAIMDAMRALLTDLRAPEDMPAMPPPGDEGEDNNGEWDDEQEFD